jgi:hypothetical protein
MIKRFLPLVLMLAWASPALAYPPCKPPTTQTLLEIWDLSGAQPNVAPWFLTSYTMSGNQNIINELRAGKCKDRMPVWTSNVSNGVIGFNPGLSSINGFGALSLPELPTIAIDHLNLRYRLDFKIDNAPLLNTGDWMDVVQLDFAHDRGLTSEGWPESSVYRVRKIRRGINTYVQVIEARAVNDGDSTSKPPPVVSVIAEIPLTGANGKTAIALRWTQQAQPESDVNAAAPMNNVNSIMEVLWLGQQTVGPANTVLYSTMLPRQWADSLLSGLLDYNVPDASAYSSNFRVVNNDVVLDAQTF